MKYQKYYVYIVTNKANTVLYTGVTNNLEQRIIEHFLERGRKKEVEKKPMRENTIAITLFSLKNISM